MVQFRTSYFPGLVSVFDRLFPMQLRPSEFSTQNRLKLISRAELRCNAHAAGLDGEAGGVGAPVSWLAKRPVGSLAETRVDNSRCRPVAPFQSNKQLAACALLYVDC
jgi:hypothetical protein